MSIALAVFIEALIVITILLGSAGAAVFIERRLERRRRSGADLRSMQKWHESAEANRRATTYGHPVTDPPGATIEQ